MLTSTITNRAGRELTLIHCSGHVHAIPPTAGQGDRRFFVVKAEGQEYTDPSARCTQAALENAFARHPLARAITVKGPR